MMDECCGVRACVCVCAHHHHHHIAPWFTGPPRTAARTRNRIGSVYSKSWIAVRGLYLPASDKGRGLAGCE